jgi:hypothetical protein
MPAESRCDGRNPVGPRGQSPGHPLRLPSTPLRSAQGDPSKTSFVRDPIPSECPRPEAVARVEGSEPILKGF